MSQPDSEQVAHDVALLLPVQLGNILVRSHLTLPGTSLKNNKYSVQNLVS